MIKTLTLALILTIAAAIQAAPATQPAAPPPFDSLPADIRQAFKNHADQFVMIEEEGACTPGESGALPGLIRPLLLLCHN